MSLKRLYSVRAPRRKRVFTWHVHGSYLLYLSQAPFDFYIPVKPGRPHGYGGRAGAFPWPDNLHEIPASEVRSAEFDCVIFQNRQNYDVDRFELLSPEQQAGARIYLEHDPPREHPTDTRHWVDDPGMLLVHVTHFNRLMWDSNRTPTRVIEHGVFIPDGIRYSGELARGIVVINELARRGRRLGADLFAQARQSVPLDLAGMQSAGLGGLGEIEHQEIARLVSRYRFFFNPIRYTSLGLAVIEAMMAGVPIVGMATTEMVTTIENGVSGYVNTDIDVLVAQMRALLRDLPLARRLGARARDYAYQRFNMERFVRDWSEAIEMVSENA
jgi:glycosyltransferase involved in cell wall biosynthesis